LLGRWPFFFTDSFILLDFDDVACLNDICRVFMNRHKLFKRQMSYRRFAMSTLLVVNSSPFHETSVSRHLSEEFVQNWKQANPNGKVITRDLTSSDLKTIDGAWVGAAYTPKDARTAEQKKALEVSDTLLGELRAADEYVFGVPMHNFGIPSVLKLWIDQVARVG
jgi:FMN-dependent NADH-azoreductase